MNLTLITAALMILAALAVVAIATGAVLAATGTDDDPSRRARQRIRALYGAAALVGVILALVAVYVFPTVYVNATEVPGLLAALGPSVAGLAFVLIAALGEALWPRPKGERRGAYLERRPVFANAADLTKWASATWGALLAGALLFFGYAAASDGDSPGRSIAYVSNTAQSAGWHGPFPGWPYGIPMLIAAAVLVVAAIVVLHLIARRPAVHGTTSARDADLRRVSATNLLKGVQLSLASSLSGVLIIAGYAAHPAGWWWGIPALALAGVVMLGAFIVLAVRSR